MPDLRERMARAIVTAFPERPHPDNDDYAEALRYADAAMSVIACPTCGMVVPNDPNDCPDGCAALLADDTKRGS